jgi:hypothetical protein
LLTHSALCLCTLTKPLRAQPLQQAAGTGTLDTSGGATAAGAAAAAHPFSEFNSTSGLVRELSTSGLGGSNSGLVRDLTLNSNYSLLAKQVMCMH